MQKFVPKVLLIAAIGIGTTCGAEESGLLELEHIGEPGGLAKPASPPAPANGPSHGKRFEHQSKVIFPVTEMLGSESTEAFVVPTGKYLVSDHFSCVGNNLKSGEAYIVKLMVRTSGNAKGISQTSVRAILGLSGEGSFIDQEVEINADAGTAIQVLGQAGGSPTDSDSSVDCRLAGYLFDIQ